MKKNNLILTIVICFLLVSINGAVASELSLSAFIKKSLSTHPYKKKIDYKKKQADFELIERDKAKFWDFTFNGSHTSGLMNSSFGTYNKDGQILSLDSRLSKVLLKTGTQFEVNAATTKVSGLPSIPGYSIPNTYASNLELTLKQPLFRNAWGVIDRHPIRLKEYELELNNINYNEKLEEFIIELVDNYLLWALNHDQVELIKIQCEKSKLQLASLEKQVKTGAKEKLALILAKKAYHVKYMSLIEKQKVLEAQSKKIQTFYDGRVNTSKEKYYPEKNTRLTINERKKVTAINLYRLIQIQDEVNQLTTRLKKSALRSEFNIFATKKLNAIESGYKDSLSKIGENQSMIVGFKYTQPIGFREGSFFKKLRNYVEIESKADDKEISNQHIDLDLLVFTLQLQYDALKSQLDEAVEIVALSEQVTQLEEKKYKQGRSQSFNFVLSAQDQYLQAQLQAKELDYYYNKAVLRLLGVYDEVKDQLMKEIDNE